MVYLHRRRNQLRAPFGSGLVPVGSVLYRGFARLAGLAVSPAISGLARQAEGEAKAWNMEQLEDIKRTEWSHETTETLRVARRPSMVQHGVKNMCVRWRSPATSSTELWRVVPLYIVRLTRTSTDGALTSGLYNNIAVVALADTHWPRPKLSS